MVWEMQAHHYVLQLQRLQSAGYLNGSQTFTWAPQYFLASGLLASSCSGGSFIQCATFLSEKTENKYPESEFMWMEKERGGIHLSQCGECSENGLEQGVFFVLFEPKKKRKRVLGKGSKTCYGYTILTAVKNL